MGLTAEQSFSWSLIESSPQITRILSIRVACSNFFHCWLTILLSYRKSQKICCIINRYKHGNNCFSLQFSWVVWFALNCNRVSCRISKNRKPKPQYACQEAFYAYTCLVIEVARSYLGICRFGYIQRLTLKIKMF